MINKTREINKNYFFREILKRIADSCNGLLITGLIIDDGLITYDLIDEDNEISVSLILSDDHGCFPRVEKIITTCNSSDLNVINGILNMFN